MTDATFEELDAQPTEELRERAFARARERHDIKFFWSIIKRLPRGDDAEPKDSDLAEVGAPIEDAVKLWGELSGRRGYGDSEPLLRAAFIDYLLKH